MFEAETLQHCLNEPLPDPEALAFGELIVILRQLECSESAIGLSKALFIQWDRWHSFFRDSVSCQDFKALSQRKGFKRPGVEAAEAFRAELSKLLGKTHDEINAMPLREALARLEGESTDELGELIHRRYLLGRSLKEIAKEVNDSGRWRLGWDSDRISKRLTRYCRARGIPRPTRKQKGNRQD